MATLRGGCHCGKLAIAFDTRCAPAGLHPRACDCSFCRKHGAAWLSDAAGHLEVTVGKSGALREYRQGSGHARFLLCADCGVLVAVVFGSGQDMLGAVNAACLEGAALFGAAVVVSPQALGGEAKIARWRQLWMPATVGHG
jgi:hypothetical protein